MEDLIRSATLLVEALRMRRNYMDISCQSFAATADDYLSNHDVPRLRHQHDQSRTFTRALLNLDSKFTASIQLCNHYDIIRTYIIQCALPEQCVFCVLQ